MDDFTQPKGVGRPNSQYVHWQPSNFNSESLHSKVVKPYSLYPMYTMVSEYPQQFHPNFQQTAIPRPSYTPSYVTAPQPWYVPNGADPGVWPLVPSACLPVIGSAGIQGVTNFQYGVQGRECSQLSRTFKPSGTEMYKHIQLDASQMDFQYPYHSTLQHDNRFHHVQSMYSEKYVPPMQRIITGPALDTSLSACTTQAHWKHMSRFRVFCAIPSGSLLGGELLVADTGKINVVCSCHGWHMSVAKFCEHAGVITTNPGSSVMMDTGESLVQWRKILFSQFGMKVPEDHVGWDWDEYNTLTQRELHRRGYQREGNSLFPGGSPLKDKVSSVSGTGDANLLGSATPIADFPRSIPHQIESQYLCQMDMMNSEKPYKCDSVNDQNMNLAFYPHGHPNMQQHDISNRLYWGYEVPAPIIQRPLADADDNFNSKGQKNGGLHVTSDSLQGPPQVEKNLVSSNIELRLGQPFEQNRPRDSSYPTSAYARISAGGAAQMPQHKLPAHERADRTACEQNVQQMVDYSAFGGLASSSNVMIQSKGVPYAVDLHSNFQISSDPMPQVISEFTYGPNEMIHNPPFPCFYNHIEDYQRVLVSSSSLQTSGKNINDEWRRTPLPNANYPAPLNVSQNDVLRDAGGCDSKSSKTPPTLVRPTVKNPEGVRNPESLLSSSITHPIEKAITSSPVQTAAPTSWIKKIVHTSHAFPSCGNGDMRQPSCSLLAHPNIAEIGPHEGSSKSCIEPSNVEGSMLHAEGPPDNDGYDYGSNSLDAHSTEQNRLPTASKDEERKVAVENVGGLTDGSQRIPGICSGRMATRLSVQGYKSTSLQPSLQDDRNFNTNGLATKSMVHAVGDAIQMEALTEESPSSFRSPARNEKTSNFDLEKKKTENTNITMCMEDDTRTKEVLHSDVLDEGSSIGKCYSSLEAEIEDIRSTGPASSHKNATVVESQTSIANSSSSNAVISDTVSNCFKVHKDSVDTERTVNTTEEKSHLCTRQPSHKSRKRGRKGLKWKSLEDTSSAKHIDRYQTSMVQEKDVIALEKSPVSDDTCQMLNAENMKHKKIGIRSNIVSKLSSNPKDASLNSEDHIMKSKVPKLAEESCARQVSKNNLRNTENATPRYTSLKYQDFSPSVFLDKEDSHVKGLMIRKEILKKSFRGTNDQRGNYVATEQQQQHEFKAVKMASLNSILQIPKNTGRFQYDANDYCTRLKEIHIWRSKIIQGHPKVTSHDYVVGKKESRKRSLWEIETPPNLNIVEVPVTKIQDARHARLSIRPNNGSSCCFRTDQFGLINPCLPEKMVTVPLKFIPSDRLATEALKEETRSLLVDCTPDEGREFKSPRVGSRYTKINSYNDDINFESNDEHHFESERSIQLIKCTDGSMKKRRRKRRRSVFSSVIRSKQPLDCCICGASSRPKNNHLIRCCKCGIVVHQACYGVPAVTRKWICRPCKAHATNTVCVLCGYGEGAMTRAKKAETFLKGLLQAWLEEENKDEDATRALSTFSSVVESLLQKDENGIEFPSKHLQDANIVNNVSCIVGDPKTTMWVHVVCALWMPGTRCVNVSTMAAFDVSKVPVHRRKWVCTICNRAGGACIKCRVPKCGATFHPWCAHRKGLLQNEALSDTEEVQFFGRCINHGEKKDEGVEKCCIEENLPGTIILTEDNYNSTCARTEGGYKRRGETAFGPLRVSLEDVAAWISIKEQKRTPRRFIRLANSDVRTHHREYIRYKEEQGWKRLVVYKSNIHALGLYTSEYIAKGEMVVEYVGEVIGLRVADKREAEYLSSGRLQYRGACYLFRIDKEHIIDATRKGGIARFVNHSCSPNCVAKIICVEKQKKVVFFAEKDIAPGEELTYDYKLEFETENRIPCYCKSAECRGYLN